MQQPARRRPSWGVIAAVVGVAAVIALLAIGLMRDDLGTSIQDALDEGSRPDAPAMTLPVLQAADGIGPAGADLALDDLRGRIVVVNFWASWCLPCITEAPVLEAVAQRYREGGEVVVLGVDSEDLTDNARAFIREHGVTYPIVRDGPGDYRRDFQVGYYPETFVIDAEGRIALKIIGEVTAEEQLTTAIEQLRAAPS